MDKLGLLLEGDSPHGTFLAQEHFVQVEDWMLHSGQMAARLSCWWDFIMDYWCNAATRSAQQDLINVSGALHRGPTSCKISAYICKYWDKMNEAKCDGG